MPERVKAVSVERLREGTATLIPPTGEDGYADLISTSRPAFDPVFSAELGAGVIARSTATQHISLEHKKSRGWPPI